jgi:hypothetical protein
MRPSRAASQAPPPPKLPAPIVWNATPLNAFEDISGHWSNPENIIDGNTATYAVCSAPFSEVWFIWADIDPVPITHVRIWGEIISPPANVPVVVKVYDNDLSDWVVVGNPVVLTHNAWTIITLPSIINAVGISVSFLSIGTSVDGLNEVQAGYQDQS